MNLDERMKDCYENRFRNYLPRRTYTIIRIDGKNFSNYTKKLTKPFDKKFSDDMIETTKFLIENIQGAKLAYVQSDEISLLLTDFDTYDTSAWFDGNIQKITSVSASMATAYFNNLRVGSKMAFFDSRVFIIPSTIEVSNYFLWRWRDCVRNSIFGFAQNYFSSKELFKKSQKEVLTLCDSKKLYWNELEPQFKDGTFLFFQSINNRRELVTVQGRTMDGYKNDYSMITYLYDFIIPKYK